jgi:hypothetical protein
MIDLFVRSFETEIAQGDARRNAPAYARTATFK